ncbi:MAG: hypothetical protein JRJ04_14850 [Deltaproteobacteria bacterium]|nr:hypothetical protein [Deltaproteobacteria bacterium]
MTNVLGVHFGHDANAALVMGGTIVADVAEERFTRIKHCSDPPKNAVQYCLEAGGVTLENIDIIAVSGRNGHEDFHKTFYTRNCSIPVPAYYSRIEIPDDVEILHFDHHLCHAAASYYLSGFQKPSLVFISDGFGDDCSVSVWEGRGADLKLLKKYGADASLGWFYGNVTEALGWIHGDGEGKTMALASCGNAKTARRVLSPFCPRYVNGRLADPHKFGSISGLKLKGSIQWHLPDADKIQKLRTEYPDEDLAAAAQFLLEEQHEELVRYWMGVTQPARLCLGGGVFLNIILNRKLINLNGWESVYIHPNPGDTGLALGAALAAIADRRPQDLPRCLETIYLGPAYTNDEIEAFLKKSKTPFQFLEEDLLCDRVAAELAENKCVGWFQGRMESGPRALGNRSILMSPSTASNKDYINNRVKFREPFRPFCPSLIAEDRYRYLVEPDAGPHMILSFTARQGAEDRIPAVVHIDGTVRPQILSRTDNPLYYKLLQAFRQKTGESALLNTSFNIKGEPIVCSPADAVRCFFSTGMDILVMGNYVIYKNNGY